MLRVSFFYFFVPPITTLFVTLFYCLSAYAIDDCELDGQHININNGNMISGKTGLIRCKDRDTGQLHREHEIHNGINKGLIRYYRQGILESEFYRNEKGNRHGIAKKFNLKGVLIEEQNYDDGKTIDLSRFWYPNGKLKRATYYEKEKRGQQASVAWTSSGLLSELQCTTKPVLMSVFNDKKYCGHTGQSSKVDLYNHRGILSSRSTHLSGKKTHYQTFWNDGKTVARELLVMPNSKLQRQFSDKGIKLLEVESILHHEHYYPKRKYVYHETGSLLTETRWIIVDEREVVESETSFYLNGQTKTREEYSKRNQLFVIKSKNYHDNGKLSFEGSYFRENRYNQYPNGVHRFFNDKGIVIQALHYDNKGRITREQGFSAEGKLIRDDEIFSDGSRRAFAKQAQ